MVEQEVYRSAEKARTSSCAFADRVARLSVEEFKKRCPADLSETYEQTVLASVLLEIKGNVEGMDDVLKVVSLGVGTKYVTVLNCRNGTVHNSYWESIRDSHAEVLAKRSFQRYLYRQMELQSSSQHESEVFLPLEKENHGFPQKVFRVRPNVRFHFYSSSQPCGNACLKKFAKGMKPKYRKDLLDNEYPLSCHTRKCFSAISRGQIACLVKNASLLPKNLTSAESATMRHVSGGIVSKEIECPPGTAPIGAHKGYIKSCSDKIAIWNAVGVQGALLSHLLVTPVYISTIVIGRKFSEVHAERALCCRLQDFHFCDTIYIHHPTIMCSSVKFDDKRLLVAPKTLSGESDGSTESIVTSISAKKQKIEGRHPGEGNETIKEGFDFDLHIDSKKDQLFGANFVEKRTLFWSEGDEFANVLDGNTGQLYGEGDDSIMIPDISSKCFFMKYCKIASNLAKNEEQWNVAFSLPAYMHLKMYGSLAFSGERLEKSAYFQAKQALCHDKNSFLNGTGSYSSFCKVCGLVGKSLDSTATCNSCLTV